MQPFIAAMQKARQTFIAAIIKSIQRTKHVLQTILAIWISPSILRSGNAEGDISTTEGRRLTATEFMEAVDQAFHGLVERKRLIALSNGLRNQILESMVDNPQCMLPSFNHQLPSGEEKGTFLALDVGGSTFRVALVELSGRRNGSEGCRILKSRSFKIEKAIKQLQGILFFDWMAERMEEVLSGEPKGHEMCDAPLPAGLAWSFPIQQTSLRSGLLQGMGKNFLAAHGLLGQDLGDLIQDSCLRKGLNVQLTAIVNDSSATLLSKAYSDPTTRFALILGTGVNAAVHLPVHTFSPAKFGIRPVEWHDSAKHVIVNTELSMFGTGILPSTSWDESLLSVHPKPTFQPLEHFVGGGYLGEIVRLVLVDGIRTAGLFGGIVPSSLKERYSLDTETLSHIESDSSSDLAKAQVVFTSRHPSVISPTTEDLQFLRRIATHVTYRAAGVIAAGVHALWQLRNEAEGVISAHTVVAYNGSVIESYPGFKRTCQNHLDTLVEASGGKKGSVELMYAEESSLLGAAIAGAIAGLDG